MNKYETEGTGPESPRQRKARVKSIARIVRECRKLQGAINRYGYTIVAPANVKSDFANAVSDTQNEAYQRLQDMPKDDILEALV